MMKTQTKSNSKARSAQSIKPGVVNVLAELRRTGKPIVVTVNRTDFVVEDERSYRHLITLVDRLETIGGIREAFQDVDAGRTLTLDEFKSEVRQRHGIPD
jgi:hypothetical protein